LGGKWEEVKRIFPSPSIGHQAWNIPLATKHGNLLLLLPLATKWGFTFTSLLLLFKRRTQIMGVSLSPDIIFNSILRIFVSTSFLRKRRMINHGSWEKER
jgi:hypothetical protein